MSTETTIMDARGLRCPLPVLKARKALKALVQGDILQVLATDPGAVKDFEAFCRTTGHRLVDCREADGVYDFRIEKATP
ncbi:MAG: tusA [Rhodospirillales bacterium]|jgi:tRNA 2-thiouridine synthesizing protein A|nr:tusA [Rhodospirillales bacterium]